MATPIRRAIVANSGRRYGATPFANHNGARVRIPVCSAHGVALPTVSDGMTTANARAFGLALIEAAALADADFALLTADRRKRA